MTHSNLVPVFNGTIALQPVQLCNARELHQFLEIDQQFADWIKKRIEDYGFVENEDYIKLSIKAKGRGRSRTEYHITLDMGKELAMVERNEKGRQIRKYFIACEKALQNTQQMLPPEPTINLTLSESELKKLVTTWLQFTRFRESAYFLIQAYNLRHNYGHNETSLVFNHDVCKRNIADTVALMQRLSAHLRTEPKAERAPTRLLGKF